MKIDRLLGILMLLVREGRATARELAGRFEVSMRTIQRDVETLGMAGVPVYAEAGRNGGYRLLDNYRLDKNFLSTSEGRVLIAFLENLERTAPFPEVKSIYGKFAAMLPGEMGNDRLVIQPEPLMNRKIFRDIFDTISEARDGCRKVRIKYIDGNFQETERTISPYTLALLGPAWYVYAYCDLREDFRLFKLNRIVACEELAEGFARREMPVDLPWENELDSGRECTEITLEMDRILLGRLPDYFDPRNCRVEKDRITVRLSFPVDEWLYSFLAGFVPYVRIVEPEYVREEFVRRLRAGWERNEL